MADLRIRYLVERPRQKGAPRRYWWPTAKLVAAGFHPRRLPDDLAAAIAKAEAFNAELDRWYGGVEARPRRAADDLAALNDLFQRDDEFRDLAERTKRDFFYNIKAALAWAGDIPVTAISTRAIHEWYRGQREAAGVASSRNHIAALRRLLSFGARQGWIADNPALHLRVKTPASRTRVWTEAERDAFVAAARAAGRPSMALAVMLGWCLGQRPSDLRTLTWRAYDGRTVEVRQAKTGARVAVPALPELRAALEATPRTSTQMVVSEVTGQPYAESDFQHNFADLRRAAGLPGDLQFKDLRRTLATALGRAGCSQDQIMAVTGHKTRGVLDVYVVPDAAMARGAMARLRRGK